MQDNSVCVHYSGVSSLRRAFTTLVQYAENECGMVIRLHCNELRALCLTTNVLGRIAEFGALLLKCVLIVYIWPEKGVYSIWLFGHWPWSDHIDIQSRINPRRRSSFRRPSRHKGVRPPPPSVWLLSELELRFKNQRVACHEIKPLTPEFKVLGQPVTFEVRPMTQKWLKCDFADNFVTEQWAS